MGISTYWNDTYAVGNELIDGQHKKLLEISGRGFQLLAAPFVSAEDCRHLLYEFAVTLQEHLDTEEKVLTHNGYSSLAGHIGEHQASRAVLDDLLRNAEKGVFYKGALLSMMANYVGDLCYGPIWPARIT